MRARLPGCLLVLVLAPGGCASAPAREPPGAAAGPAWRAAVAADHRLASEAGLEMLRRGGNAVDAAVAASFCLSVVRPYSCGIGGGGFMLIYDPAGGRAVALNYRETAPGAVGPDYYVRGGDRLASRIGVRAVGVPGTVAGLLAALEQYGTLDRATVLAPAIRVAQAGWEADAGHVSAAREAARRLGERPQIAPLAGTVWTELCREGRVQVGDRLRNPQQAAALRHIARDGAAAFYRGPVAEAIVGVVQGHGGPMTAADLAGYRLRATPPLRGTLHGWLAGLEVLAMPPPSSGGVAELQVLGILDRSGADLDPSSPADPRYVHLAVEAMKHAFADRSAWMADDQFADVPVEALLAPAYLDGLARSISLQRTGTPADYGSGGAVPGDAGTSHLSVIDEHGMAVACTETINLEFGSLVEVPGFGFVLNDEMDDFTTFPGEPNAFGLVQADRNLPQPGKRPLSSMSPTIVLRDGRVVLVAGASGGPRIISATLQVMLDCLAFGLSPAQAVALPRFHHQWLPDTLYAERDWGDADAVAFLEARGHTITRRDDIGIVQVVQWTPEGVRAASDPRKGGRPAGQ